MATYFNGTLWKRNLIRFWPLSVAAFLAAMFLIVIPEAAAPRGISVGTGIVFEAEMKNIIPSLEIYCTVAVPLMSILSAIAVFGYLHNPKAAGFVSSLPVTRLGLYITNWLSGLILILAPALLAGALYGMLVIGQPVPSGDYLRWLGILIATHLIFFSMASFFTFLTGNPVMQAFLYGAFNFIYIALYGIVTLIAQMVVFGFSLYSDSAPLAFAGLLTPPAAILRTIQIMAGYSWRSFGYEEFMPPVALLWALYLTLAALMVVFGFLLYRRRRIESAGDLIIHRPVKAIFKYLIGFFTGVLLALLFVYITLAHRDVTASVVLLRLTVPMVIFGVLGCLFAEMLIRKRMRVWKTAYKGIIGYVFVIIALMLFIRFDGTGYERRVPDPSDVAAVSFTTRSSYAVEPLHRGGRGFSFGGENWSLSWPYVQQQQALGLPLFDDAILHEIKLRSFDYFESPEAIAVAVRLHQSIIDDRRDRDGDTQNWLLGRYYLTYTMNDGSVMTREYLLPIVHEPMHETVALLLELYNQPEAMSKRNRFVPLPEESVLGAIVTPALHLWWDTLNSYSYTFFDPQGHILLPDDDGLHELMQALRQDAADGTLGRIRHVDLMQSLHFYDDRSDVTFIIDLNIDLVAAGVPTAIVGDYFMVDDRDFIGTVGLLQRFVINEDNVNTLRALEELGIIEEFADALR